MQRIGLFVTSTSYVRRLLLLIEIVIIRACGCMGKKIYIYRYRLKCLNIKPRKIHEASFKVEETLYPCDYKIYGNKFSSWIQLVSDGELVGWYFTQLLSSLHG